MVKILLGGILICLVTGLGCASGSKGKSAGGISWTKLLSAQANVYAKHECMERVPPNTLRKGGLVLPVFVGFPGVLPGLLHRFQGDKTAHTQLIMGDSTAQSWQGIPGLTKGWRNVAVRGNRICNMIVQARKYGRDRIRRVIISSNGGNDVLEGYSRADLVKDFRALLARTRKLYPGAKITVVGIHAVLDGDLFETISGLNKEVSGLSRSEKFCYVNPVKVLGTDSGGRLPEKYRARLDSGEIDKIHYNNRAGRLIFRAAVACGR